MGRVVFVTGGARSGKSTFAEGLAAGSGAPVVYVATMEARDDELRDRVARHRARRPAGWTTAEEPLDLARVLREAPPGATVLLDCLSLWVSNLLLEAVADPDGAEAAVWSDAIEAIVRRAEGVLATQRERPGTLVAVTNEVGLGIVPANALARAYRDALGLVNQRFAAASEEAHLLVSGLPLRLR